MAACSQTSQKTAAPSSASLDHYDAAVTQLLNEITKNPTSNDGGQVVWGTRYYLESLLVAYEATGNQKYVDAFVQTGNTVFNIVQHLTVLDVPDPSVIQPSNVSSAPTRDVTGWPTNIGTLGQPIPVPTAGGDISLYAQTLWPTPSTGSGYLQVSAAPAGGIVLNFELGGRVWQSYTAQTVNDLQGIAHQPIAYGATLGRIFPTGLGLPTPGLYALDTPLHAVWHAEQTGGILLPFARLLLLAKSRPSIIDSDTAMSWQSQVVNIASSYEEEMLSDGNGGLVLTNAYWMPSPYAGLPVETDYINAEISLRMVLGLLTADQHQFDLAQGLLRHEMTKISMSSQNWLLIKESPDVPSWSQPNDAPYGAIWASYSGDNKSPESSTEGGFFVEALQIASDNALGGKIGLTKQMCEGEKATFQGYLRIPAPGVNNSLIRSTYPTSNSQASDSPIPSNDPEDAARYAQPITENASFVCDNWNWMLKNGITTDEGVGHILLDWARSEAAWKQLGSPDCPTQ